MTRVLVTGATGFVGQALCQLLVQRDVSLVATSRSVPPPSFPCQHFLVAPLDSGANWSVALKDCDVVVHLAARAHVMKDSASNSLAEYRKVNVEGTRHLALAAVKSGVKRFIYMSSIKVNGEETTGAPFRFDDIPAPQDPYGVSKLEAEEALIEVAQGTGMELVIIRPPLVYGPGVKGNLASLSSLVRKGIPLPFGMVNNKRDLVSVNNLCDLVFVCLSHNKAAGKVFLVSDGMPVSTKQLVKLIALGIGSRARLWPVPVCLMSSMARLVGKGKLTDRLFGDLQVDIDETREQLGWQPPYPVEDEFIRAFRLKS
ncbi:MAG: hypothetical protein CSA52_01120 [Gammaproteobacteria bacterium]|nr:MAG: hypothetical protein CSB48_13030 [Pseudomonadota bacterium]PIE38782.1 MAG: hypothetical protein CSA52_01120 [Gammaproteobacteria bacterium]